VAGFALLLLSFFPDFSLVLAIVSLIAVITNVAIIMFETTLMKRTVDDGALRVYIFVIAEVCVWFELIYARDLIFSTSIMLSAASDHPCEAHDRVLRAGRPG